MAARYLLDTNICIYIRREHPLQVLKRFERLKAGEAALSIITYGELFYGAEKSQQGARAMRQLDELSSLLPMLPLPEDASRRYGEIRAALEKKGEMIGNNDLWIAAHAKAANLVLVTNNEREFRRVAGLKVENWMN